MSPSELIACLGAPRPAGPAVLSLFDWLTALAYLACAVLAVLVIRRQGRAAGRGVWVIVLVLGLGLAVNEVLGLQSALTGLSRCYARAAGYYAERQDFQRSLLVSLLVFGLLAIAVLLVATRRHIGRNWLAVAGLAVLAGLAAVRAVSLHDLDAALGGRVLLLRNAAWIEMSGAMLIVWNAAAHLRRPRPGRRHRRRRRRAAAESRARTGTPAGDVLDTPRRRRRRAG